MVLINMVFTCEVCKKEFQTRMEVHTQRNNSNKGWRYICCMCLGHKLLSCLDDLERNTLKSFSKDKELVTNVALARDFRINRKK